MTIESVLTEAINDSLQWCNYENATFLAERLVAEDRNNESLLLLARTYVRSGRFSYAYSILKGLQNHECRFLFARCCLELGKLQEGELALTGALFPGIVSDVADFSITRGAACALLGDICKKAGRIEQATEYYKKSLNSNPFIWTSFEALAKLGARPDPEKFFKGKHSADGLNSSHNFQTLPVPAQLNERGSKWETPLPNRLDISNRTTPAASITPQSQTRVFPSRLVEPFALAGSPAAVPIVSALGSPAPWSCSTPSAIQAPTAAAEPPPAVRKSTRLIKITKDGSPVVRRSMRLFSSTKGKAKDFKRTSKSDDSDCIGKGKIDYLTLPSSVSQSNLEYNDQASSTAGTATEYVATILCQCGKAVSALEEYKCKEAVSALEGLPDSHFRTAWTYIQMGRAYFELADYSEADKNYRMARRIAPYRSQGMEFYSTTLWHLRQETSLSYLAHEVTSADRLSPEAWCVVGNCFSLQKEHNQAVKFFQRAVQLDSSFSYAYTLLGHEFVYNENFAQALNCFRAAIDIDARHYNAWYGLGMIYYRQEKYDLAEYHFAKAIQINPRSAILLCYLGIVQHAQDRSKEALENMLRASRINDNIPLVKFNKAVILAALKQNIEALAELSHLKRIASKESSVYFLMGKVYQQLGKHDDAMMHFSWAKDLDPKGNNNMIREAINKQLAAEDDPIEYFDVNLSLPEITSTTMEANSTASDFPRLTNSYI